MRKSVFYRLALFVLITFLLVPFGITISKALTMSALYGIIAIIQLYLLFSNRTVLNRIVSTDILMNILINCIFTFTLNYLYVPLPFILFAIILNLLAVLVFILLVKNYNKKQKIKSVENLNQFHKKLKILNSIAEGIVLLLFIYFILNRLNIGIRYFIISLGILLLLLLLQIRNINGASVHDEILENETAEVFSEQDYEIIYIYVTGILRAGKPGITQFKYRENALIVTNTMLYGIYVPLSTPNAKTHDISTELWLWESSVSEVSKTLKSLINSYTLEEVLKRCNVITTLNLNDLENPVFIEDGHKMILSDGKNKYYYFIKSHRDYEKLFCLLS